MDGLLNSRRSTISNETFSVAVAVTAMIGTLGLSSLSLLILKYDGLKSCPH